MNIFNKLKQLFTIFREINLLLRRLQLAVGRIEQRQLEDRLERKFSNYEFQVYSQWGEDGLIQYLINNVVIENPVFVEFGVETYTESNTRFLLVNNNWSGLVIDGSEKNIDHIKQDPIYWKYNLKTQCAFIDKDNINDLILKNGISGDIGLLSVDIDGNDYWVWDAIDCIRPRIVICEYNSVYGPNKQVTVPYDSKFYRSDAHYSNLYWGASISAFTSLAEAKGYALIGSNSAGNNIFFVRKDVMGSLDAITPQAAHTASQFRESKDVDGKLTLLPFVERLSAIEEMPLVDLTDNQQYQIGKLYGL